MKAKYLPINDVTFMPVENYSRKYCDLKKCSLYVIDFAHYVDGCYMVTHNVC